MGDSMVKKAGATTSLGTANQRTEGHDPMGGRVCVEGAGVGFDRRLHLRVGVP